MLEQTHNQLKIQNYFYHVYNESTSSLMAFNIVSFEQIVVIVYSLKSKTAGYDKN